MRKIFLGSFVCLGLLLLAAGASTADKYPFALQGNVKEVNTDQNTLTVEIKTTSAMINSMKGERKDIKLYVNTKIYKTGKRIKLGNVVVGDRVSVKGVVKSDNSLVAKTITVQDMRFEVRGKIVEVNTGSNQVKVNVVRSTYKPKTYKGKDITFDYDDNTVILIRGKVVEEGRLANDQKIYLKGKIIDSETWYPEKIVTDLARY